MVEVCHLGLLRGWGISKATPLKERMKMKWNFQRGGSGGLILGYT